MKTFLYTLAFILIILMAFRYFPVNTEPFHVDPAEPDERRSEVRLIGRDAPRFPATAREVLETIVDIATSEPGVRIVEGDIDEGMVTLVARSRVFGFRDFITLKAVDEAGGAKLSVFARPRINGYDWGVNAKRLDRWLGELQQTLGG